MQHGNEFDHVLSLSAPQDLWNWHLVHYMLDCVIIIIIIIIIVCL